jgi:hypothetical protein
MKASARIIQSSTPDELNLDALPPHVNGGTPSKISALPITSFTYPEGDDPTSLLGADDYLNRGGGMFFVSYAGVGKSSWIMDACMMWALGRPWLGIRCAKPLKSLIIQSEDSNRYIGKIQSSFAHVNALNPDQIQQVGNNCLVARLKGVFGAAFFTELKALTNLHQPDLVVINPVYIFAEGDIGRSEFAQPFLANLEAVNHAERFGYILVHHTGKPAKQSNGKRTETEDWESAYMGFGSSYFANWPRCSAMLEPVAGAEGRYMLKLGKGRYNAGVTKEVQQGAGTRTEPATQIAIRHSRALMPVSGKNRPVFYWDIDNGPPAEEEAKSKGGRPPSLNFSEYLSVFPRTRATAQTFAEILRSANSKQPTSKTPFFGAIKEQVLLGVLGRDDTNPNRPKFWLNVD